jgi:hypothetical protein
MVERRSAPHAGEALVDVTNKQGNQGTCLPGANGKQGAEARQPQAGTVMRTFTRRPRAAQARSLQDAGVSALTHQQAPADAQPTLSSTLVGGLRGGQRARACRCAGCMRRVGAGCVAPRQRRARAARQPRLLTQLRQPQRRRARSPCSADLGRPHRCAVRCAACSAAAGARPGGRAGRDRERLHGRSAEQRR